MNSFNPPVSVIIRNRNEAEHLKFVLEALERQEYKNFEIVLVDNNSTDESLELAKNAQAKIVSIDKFTYGGALNLGIREASGEIIVILSAHSIPLGRYFLTECASAFEDQKLGAARLVYSGKKADITRWLKVEYLTAPDEDFISKGPLASGCVIRKKVWEEVPFDEEIIAAEEKIWAYEILKKGYKIASPIPAFYYYNKRLSPVSELNKNYRELVAIYKKLGMRNGFVQKKGQILTDLFLAVVNSVAVFGRRIKLEITKAYLRSKFPNL